MAKVIIKNWLDDPPVTRVCIICNHCGTYMNYYNYNPSSNSFVCPSCKRTWYNIIPLSRYRKLKQQAELEQKQDIQRQKKEQEQYIITRKQNEFIQNPKPEPEPNKKFKDWTEQWARNWNKKTKKKGRKKHKERILEDIEITRLSRV